MAENELTLDTLLTSVKLDAKGKEVDPLIGEGLEVQDADKNFPDEQRFVASLAAILRNLPEDFAPKKRALAEARGADTGPAASADDLKAKPVDKQHIQELIQYVDQLINGQLDEILHHKDFQAMEANWAAVDDLVKHTNFKKDIILSIVDVSKDKAFEDLELNSADIAGSEIFKKLYVAEYDQFGGIPYGAVIGLYDFANTPDDRTWLSTIGKICCATHAPFVGAVNPKFFGCDNMEQVNELRDLGSLMSTPKYGAWNELRKTEQAVYIGLTLPKYIVRPPYNPETNPARGVDGYAETANEDDEFVWANSAALFARNLVRSFETSGWCQHIRGVKGGGQIADLPAHEYDLRGEKVLKLPVEVAMPDYREYELAKAGFIPLIQKKNSNEAVFFSAQSIKFVDETFVDPKLRENAALVANMSYTYSISRIAHYIKLIMRDNIGSSANQQYIHNQIDRWISRYVTALVNPDDLTLRYYPFKAYNLKVEEVEGKLGWYHCELSILPHIQFEGMDVDLRVDANLA